ncbi:MAG TPA: DUF58 domain-containing protein [Thermoanaerobaculia bacterium]
MSAQARRHLLWTAVVGGLLLLLSFFSAGFFLYAALVAGGFALATAVTLTSLLGLEVRRRLAESEIELGQAVEARLVVANRKELPAPWLFWEEKLENGLDVEGPKCAYKTLAAKEDAELVYRLHSLRRGLFRVGPAVVEASGPFGLVRRFLVDRDVRFLTVLPKSVGLAGGWPLGHRPIHEIPRRRSLFEDPTRFIGTRDYRPGDPLRRVHWRATARSRTIQVKLYEPAVLEGALVAVEMDAEAYPGLDLEAEAGDPRVELTVTAAAAIVELVLAGDQRAGLLANGSDAAERYADWTGGSFRRLDDALEEAAVRRRAAVFRPLEVAPAQGARQLARLRTALARLTPARGPALPELLDVELPRLPRSLVLMVVTPRLDAALAGVTQTLRRSGIECAVVWTGAEPERAAAALPAGVPIYPVAGEADLERLGRRRL